MKNNAMMGWMDGWMESDRYSPHESYSFTDICICMSHLERKACDSTWLDVDDSLRDEFGVVFRVLFTP